MTTFAKMMPVVALVMGAGLAFATSAFRSTPAQKDGKPLTTYNFRYVAPATNPYSDANVKDTANWEYSASPADCEDGQDAPCFISDVHEDHVVLTPGQDPRLDPSVNIQTATTSIPGNYQLASVSDGTIANKAL